MDERRRALLVGIVRRGWSLQIELMKRTAQVSRTDERRSFAFRQRPWLNIQYLFDRRTVADKIPPSEQAADRAGHAMEAEMEVEGEGEARALRTDRVILAFRSGNVAPEQYCMYLR